jgi:hypothetical protein
MVNTVLQVQHALSHKVDGECEFSSLVLALVPMEQRQL